MYTTYMVDDVKKMLSQLRDPLKSKILGGFFKTGKGDGDTFLGITVPNQRTVALKYKDLPLTEIKELLSENIHEYRLTALLILVYKNIKADKKLQKQIYDFYLKNTKYINNWDLVDSSASQIVGKYLLNSSDRSILYKLVKSPNIWERRIAMVATHQFIIHKDFDAAFKIAALLLTDKHDLIHKASGWMLREAGKRDRKAEEAFLLKYYKVMPRTMLRYAIEHFDEEKKKFFMKKD